MKEIFLMVWNKKGAIFWNIIMVKSRVSSLNHHINIKIHINVKMDVFSFSNGFGFWYEEFKKLFWAYVTYLYFKIYFFYTRVCFVSSHLHES